MALLTLIVWVRMLVVRIGEMRRLRIHLQSVATLPQAAQKYVDTRAATTSATPVRVAGAVLPRSASP